MGIFGYLSKAHIDQTLGSGDNTLQIQMLDQRIQRQQNKLNDANRVIEQLDKSVETLIQYDRIRGRDGAIAVRKSQTEERTNLNTLIESAANEISKLRDKKLILKKEQLKFEAEVGPIKYIADLIYGDQAKEMIDEAVRGVIILLVVVFDPLAILLIVAAGGIDVAPKQPKRKSQKYIKEVMTYAKNISKWEQAEKYCELRGWEFKIVTEKEFKSLGIRLLNL